jgi:hypothetical protein
MLIPQFSLRWLLALTALCAGLSLILSFAFRGQTWAIGMATALGSIAGMAVLYVTAFLSAWLVTQVAAGLYRRPQGQSPFAKLPGGETPFATEGVMADSPMSEGPPAITG